MPKYELTIKADYLSGGPNAWGLYEGCRELVQNARDAEVQYGASMSVKFAERVRDGKKTGAVVILNEGVILPKEALLIGHTSKLGDERLIGKFGEGLKFGILALLRLGVEIKIRNGDEVWIPSIARSEKFEADVLVFDVRGGNKYENRLQFEIVGVDRADWEDIEKKLLFLSDYPEHVKVEDGNILTGPNYKGKIFVKGMFVAHTDRCFGYDFHHADIDRDRRMVNSLNDKTSLLLSQAINKGELVSQIFDLMYMQSPETEYVSIYRLSHDACEHLAEEYQQNFPNTIPVDSEVVMLELQAFNKSAKVVHNYYLRNALESVLGSSSQTLQELRKSEKKSYTLGELTQTERDTLRRAVTIVSDVAFKVGESKLTTDRVLVVDFNKSSEVGTYDPQTGIIRLARSLLSDLSETVYVLIHEIAHSHGADGIRSHEDAIGKMVVHLLKGFLK